MYCIFKALIIVVVVVVAIFFSTSTASTMPLHLAINSSTISSISTVASDRTPFFFVFFFFFPLRRPLSVEALFRVASRLNERS